MTIKYRPEIDGLRAIAVIAVVLYHTEFVIFGINPFKGGFIGVDIFFVISGYLITSIILKEITEGKFSFLRFYERRARRILPALFTVMLASIPFAWIFMLPKAMKEYAGSILSSLVFGSNFWFWREDSYWAEPSTLKPFLHTWSLSVEEQFYIGFPIALVILWKFARQHLTSTLAMGFLLSLLIAEVGVVKHPSFAFYLLPSRGWELLAGVVLAKLEIDNGRVSRPYLDAFMPALGLFLISYAIVCFDENTKHPSFITLIPVLGTMMIIWFGRKREFVTGILSSKPAVGIGLISYGFYLWHYPIFAFARMNNNTPSYSDRLEWIILSLALSLITFIFIERPARNFEKLKSSLFIISILVVFLILSIANITLWKTNGAEFRIAEFKEWVDLNYFAKERGNREYFWTYKGCWWDGKTTPEKPFAECKLKEEEFLTPKIMIIGDSNLASMVPGLIHFYGRRSIIQRNIDECLPIITDNSCRKGLVLAFKEIDTIKPDLIILGGKYANEENIVAVGKTIVNHLSNYLDKIVVYGPLPRWGDYDNSNHLTKKLRLLYQSNPLKVHTSFYLAPDRHTFELDDIAMNMSSELKLRYLSPVEALCKKEEMTCLAKLGKDADSITTFDYGHLTHKASIYMVENMKPEIDYFIYNN